MRGAGRPETGTLGGSKGPEGATRRDEARDSTGRGVETDETHIKGIKAAELCPWI